MRKIFPGRAAGAVVLAHSSPLPLGEVGPPPAPVGFARFVVLEALVFGGGLKGHRAVTRDSTVSTVLISSWSDRLTVSWKRSSGRYPVMSARRAPGQRFLNSARSRIPFSKEILGAFTVPRTTWLFSTMSRMSAPAS